MVRSRENVKPVNDAAPVLDPDSEDYPAQLRRRWKERLPDIDASSVPVFSVAAAVGRKIEIFYDGLLKPLGYQLSEYRLLVGLRIGEESGMTPADLNLLLKQTSAGITKTVARLEKRELITRSANPSDNRSIVVKLTAKGRREVNTLCKFIAAEQNKKLSAMSRAERDQAMAGLMLLSQHI